MSKIVSPYPPLLPNDDYTPPIDAQWWRFRLQPNDDGYTMVIETDARDGDMDSATWAAWEFFDGENTIIDAGLDRPLPVVITYRDSGGWIDVLHVGPPTPSPRWEKLAIPGWWPHPGVQKESVMLG